MGVSSRAAQVIEPANGDLLMPDWQSRPRASRPRDVEDASFETIGRPRPAFSSKLYATETRNFFGSGTSDLAGQGPVPADYADVEPPLRQSEERTGRLNVFAGAGAAPSSGGSKFAMAASVAALTMCGLAAAALWNSGIPAPRPQIDVRAPTIAPPALKAPAAMVEAPPTLDPVATGSVPASPTVEIKSGYSIPAPRPARIEKAGSILMIRPGGS